MKPPIALAALVGAGLRIKRALARNGQSRMEVHPRHLPPPERPDPSGEDSAMHTRITPQGTNAVGTERRGLRWGVSAAATLGSTYLLDLVATVSGLLLVASPLLDSARTGGLLVVLAASYVVWGFGLPLSDRLL